MEFRSSLRKRQYVRLQLRRRVFRFDFNDKSCEMRITLSTRLSLIFRDLLHSRKNDVRSDFAHCILPPRINIYVYAIHYSITYLYTHTHILIHTR